jgi:hypothetical protein
MESTDDALKTFIYDVHDYVTAEECFRSKFWNKSDNTAAGRSDSFLPLLTLYLQAHDRYILVCSLS